MFIVHYIRFICSKCDLYAQNDAVNVIYMLKMMKWVRKWYPCIWYVLMRIDDIIEGIWTCIVFC